MPDPTLLDEKSREAIHAQRDAAQAVEFARKAQIDNATESAATAAANLAARQIADKIVERKEMVQLINEAVMKGFSFEDDDGRRRFIDVTKEKLICQSIITIDKRLSSIEMNLNRAVWIVLTAVILAVLGLLFVKH